MRRVLSAVLAAGLLVVVSATSSSAVVQERGPANCGNREVIIASSTIGSTEHATSTGLVWNKGYRDGGATTYTGRSSFASVIVTAPTIRSMGYRCND